MMMHSNKAIQVVSEMTRQTKTISQEYSVTTLELTEQDQFAGKQTTMPQEEQVSVTR